MVSKNPKRQSLRTRYPAHVRLYGCAASLRKLATKRDMEQKARNLIHGISDTIERIAESLHLRADKIDWTGEGRVGARILEETKSAVRDSNERRRIRERPSLRQGANPAAHNSLHK